MKSTWIEYAALIREYIREFLNPIRRNVLETGSYNLILTWDVTNADGSKFHSHSQEWNNLSYQAVLGIEGVAIDSLQQLLKLGAVRVASMTPPQKP